jgi:hypothetical protein
MDFHNCVLRHAGNLGMTVHKTNIPTPEIVLLRYIHGPDSVVQIETVRNSIPTDQRKLRDDMVRFYGDKFVDEVFPSNGMTARLPTTLAEAGIGVEEEPVEEDPASDRVLAPPPAVAEKLNRAKAAAQSLVG